MKNIIILLGTAREGRQSAKVARFIFELAQKRSDAHFSFIDVADFQQSRTLALDDNKKKIAQEALTKSDAIIIVSPEYNHSYPGELKMFLDNRFNLGQNKVVAICGVSSGAIGGARMAEQLKLVLNTLDMQVIRNSVFFSQVADTFLDSGEIKDRELWEKKMNDLFNDLVSALA